MNKTVKRGKNKSGKNIIKINQEHQLTQTKPKLKHCFSFRLTINNTRSFQNSFKSNEPNVKAQDYDS